MTPAGSGSVAGEDVLHVCHNRTCGGQISDDELHSLLVEHLPEAQLMFGSTTTKLTPGLPLRRDVACG